eukprot:750890-Hanusia_phi.AAC.2
MHGWEGDGRWRLGGRKTTTGKKWKTKSHGKGRAFSSQAREDREDAGVKCRGFVDPSDREEGMLPAVGAEEADGGGGESCSRQP